MRKYKHKIAIIPNTTISNNKNREDASKPLMSNQESNKDYEKREENSKM